MLAAKVVSCEIEGGDALVQLDAGERLIAKLTRGAAQRLALAPGSQVFIVLKATAIRRLA